MITLLTGTPGAGKTLYMIKRLVEELIPTGRQIYCNIDGLNIDAPNLHVVGKDEPLNWQARDDGAIFVFDEVQEQYPPRNSQSRVPPYVSGYETHRHRGFDFWFVTQGPRLIDRHLHDLISRHIHLYRPFNMSRSVVYEWNLVNPTPAPPQSKSTAQKNTFVFPKRYFRLYKSASVHTMKLQLPRKTLLMLAGIAAFALFAAFKLWGFIHDPFNAQQPSLVAETSASSPCVASLVASAGPNIAVRSASGILMIPRSSVSLVDGRPVIDGFGPICD